jgi:hypothetical protein
VLFIDGEKIYDKRFYKSIGKYENNSTLAKTKFIISKFFVITFFLKKKRQMCRTHLSEPVCGGESSLSTALMSAQKPLGFLPRGRSTSTRHRCCTLNEY